MTTTVLYPRRELGIILASLARHYNRAYCYPSQAKILAIYRGRTGAAMSRRTLNRHLAALVRDGWITRTRRHRRGANGQIELHSTLYVIGRACWRWLANVAGKMVKSLRKSRVPQVAQQVASSQPIMPAAPNTGPPDRKISSVAAEQLRRMKEITRR